MKKTDALVRLLQRDIEYRDVLEVACGTADFSVSAAPFAKSVSCMDLDADRLGPRVAQSGVCFRGMDARSMDYPDGAFDAVVLYNAFYHVQADWDEIEPECKRVLKRGGKLVLAATWKLDMGPMLDRFGDRAERRDGFLIVTLTNE